jgi:hypothetical protein
MITATTAPLNHYLPGSIMINLTNKNITLQFFFFQKNLSSQETAVVMIFLIHTTDIVHSRRSSIFMKKLTVHQRSMATLNNHNISKYILLIIKMIIGLQGRKMIYNGCNVCHESIFNVPLRYHVAPLPLFTQ